MADIAQANVTVTQTNDDEEYTGQRTNVMSPSVAFGDGALTYPTYGIPIPDLTKFRLKSHIKRLYITQPTGAYAWVFDKTARAANPVAPNGTLRAYARADGTEMSGAVAATSLDLEIRGA